MQILNIAGYKFIQLLEIEALRACFLEQCRSLDLKGTILLSQEGINLSLAGTPEQILSFRAFLQNDTRFMDMQFHESYSDSQPFQRLKVKLKKEIITLGQPDANPLTARAPAISPEEFKQWLDEKRDITILDTRNDYEVQFGTFTGAVNLHLADFGELPNAVHHLEREKPIVMFCTGGIRCEKAALHMLSNGFTNIYQLDGGILGYFRKIGGAHYDGDCFVFDERISLDSQLNISHTQQCSVCQQPVTVAQQALPAYVANVSCPACAS